MGRLPALLIALASVAQLAGCGGGSHSQAVSSAVLVDAVRATQATGSYAFSLGGSFDVGGQGFPIHGGGAVDARTGRARIRIDLRQGLTAIGITRADAVVDRYTRGLSTARLLAFVRAAGTVRRVGTDDVAGAKTTHYSTQIDLKRYAQTARPDEVSALNKAVQQVGDSLPVDVWVDGSDRIRRIQAQVATASFQALPRLDIGGFGRPVAIGRP